MAENFSNNTRIFKRGLFSLHCLWDVAIKINVKVNVKKTETAIYGS